MKEYLRKNHLQLIIIVLLSVMIIRQEKILDNIDWCYSEIDALKSDIDEIQSGIDQIKDKLNIY